MENTVTLDQLMRLVASVMNRMEARRKEQKRKGAEHAKRSSTPAAD
jgi:hypothetical protein